MSGGLSTYMEYLTALIYLVFSKLGYSNISWVTPGSLTLSTPQSFYQTVVKLNNLSSL